MKKTTDATNRRLVRLEELKGFDVADSDSDIRGWEVKTPDGKKIGKVDELIVDPAERRVRYADIKVRKDALGVDADRHVLVPIGTVRLDEKHDEVLIERLPARGLAGVPEYNRGAITSEYESSLRDYYGVSASEDVERYYDHDLYDSRGMRRSSAAATDARPATTHTHADETRPPERRTTETHHTAHAHDAGAMPRLGDKEVTVPLVDNQEIVIRKPGSDQEIVVRKRTGDADAADR